MKLFLGILLCLFLVVDAKLTVEFYDKTCFELQGIVKTVVRRRCQDSPRIAPGILKLFFLDCMVEGCDASVLIDTPTAERTAEEMHSLSTEAVDTIVEAKSLIEEECPFTVSCADIVVLAAKEAVELLKGPTFNVLLGRRDGLVSEASRVVGNIPSPNFHLKTLKTFFSKFNLSLEVLVALSAGHSVGSAHCREFSKRLYPSPVDPTMDPEFALKLKRLCPPDELVESSFVSLEYKTPRILDNQYYYNLIEGRGLLTSDQVLFTDPTSQGLVKMFSRYPLMFNQKFASAMTQLSFVGIKTDDRGEIRRVCTSFGED